MKTAVLREAWMLPGMLACCVLLAGPAAADSPASFKAFKLFCIDSNADPAAVRSGVVAGGGKAEDPPPSVAGDTTIANAMNWSVSVDGETITVGIGDLHSDFDKAHGRYSQTCSVTSKTWDGDGLDAARQWVGVPASHALPMGHFVMEIYDFQQDGNLRTPLPSDDDAFRILERSGRVWALGLTATAKGTIFTLEHTLPLAASP